jgi:hypothetical protein
MDFLVGLQMTDIAAFVMTRRPRAEATATKTARLALPYRSRRWIVILGLLITALIGIGASLTSWTIVRPACSCALPPIHIDSLRPAVLAPSGPAQIKSLRP